MTGPALVLASESPRRAQLLSMLGLHFDVVPARIDEAYRTGETPAVHAERLAREKASRVAHQHGDALVIGSDTVVVIDGQVLGKPQGDEDAVRMLLSLSGREHVVTTAIAVAHATELRSTTEQVRVHFRAFDRPMAQAYVATGEPRDKAGAYGIQGFGAVLVDRIDGDFFAVMGLPICRLLALIETLGWRYDFAGHFVRP
jgi:septum formation protein